MSGHDFINARNIDFCLEIAHYFAGKTIKLEFVNPEFGVFRAYS
jgi:hypothetical protein